MDMVERVARAICKAEGFDPNSTETTEASYWTTWEKHARAAIAAMREPTDGMELAAYAAERASPSSNLPYGIAYSAMIDAALMSSETQA